MFVDFRAHINQKIKKIGIRLTGFESDFADEYPLVLEFEAHHEVPGGTVLERYAHDTRVLGHAVLARLMRRRFFLPALALQRKIHFRLLEQLTNKRPTLLYWLSYAANEK